MADSTKGEDNKGIHKKIGQQTAGVASFLVFGRFLSLFISGLAFIIVARILGPSIYGVYTLAIAYAGFFGGIADLGIGLATNKFIGEQAAKENKNEINKIISNSYTSVIISGFAFTAVAFALSGFIASHVIGNISQTYVLQIVSFAIAGAMLFVLSYDILIGLGKGKYVALIIVFQSVIQSALSIAFVIAGFGAIAPILGMLIAYASSTIIALSIVKIKFNIKFTTPSFDYISKMVKFSIPISIYYTLEGFIWNISPIILGISTTTVVVGNFGIGLKISNVVLNLTNALATTLLPMFAYTLSRKVINKSIDKFYNYAAYLTFVLITPGLFYMAFLSKQFSFTVFSAKYMFAPVYISIISMGAFLWILATYTTMLLISANRIKDILKYSIIMTIIDLVLLFSIVPIFGGTGVTVIMFIIAPAMITAFLSWPSRKFLNIKLNVKKLFKVVMAGFISALFLIPVIFIMNTHYILILIAGIIEQIVLYPAIIVLIGAAGKEELTTLRDVSSHIPILNALIKLFTDYAGYFLSMTNKMDV